MLQSNQNCLTAIKKTDTKIERTEDTTITHEHRITALKTMADVFDQQKRSTNIVVRGLKQHIDPKTSAIERITSALRHTRSRKQHVIYCKTSHET